MRAELSKLKCFSRPYARKCSWSYIQRTLFPNTRGSPSKIFLMQIQDDMQTLKQAYRLTDIPAKLKSTEYNLDLTEVTAKSLS